MHNALTHRELPDGVNLISAKGGKSKGWQDSKLYFGMSPNFLVNLLFIHAVTCVPIPDVIHTGKAKAKRTAGKHHNNNITLLNLPSLDEAELTDNNEESHDYYTRSKKRKNTADQKCDTSKEVNEFENLFTVDTYDWGWPSDDNDNTGTS